MQSHTKSIVRAVVPWMLNGALAACLLWAIRAQPVNATEPHPYECCNYYMLGCPSSCAWSPQIQEYWIVKGIGYYACTSPTGNALEQCAAGANVHCGSWVGYIEPGCTIPSTLSGFLNLTGCGSGSDYCDSVASSRAARPGEANLPHGIVTCVGQSGWLLALAKTSR
jgi:hypothetical protein